MLDYVKCTQNNFINNIQKIEKKNERKKIKIYKLNIKKNKKLNFANVHK